VRSAWAACQLEVRGSGDGPEDGGGVAKGAGVWNPAESGWAAVGVDAKMLLATLCGGGRNDGDGDDEVEGSLPDVPWGVSLLLLPSSSARRWHVCENARAELEGRRLRQDRGNGAEGVDARSVARKSWLGHCNRLIVNVIGAAACELALARRRPRGGLSRS
jgi:hypothetical protein